MVAVAIGSVREDVVERERGARLVLVPDVDEVERMRGRRHVGEVELGDDADRIEDRSELLGEALDLLVGQREPRKPCDVENFLSSKSPSE